MIRTDQLRKFFDMGRGRQLHAVDGVTLTIEANEILGLVGESGSGKSTFGKTLIGLHERTSGDAFLGEARLPAKFSASDHLRFSKSMQMIFQDPYASLNPRMTVLDIVGEGLSIRGERASSVRDRVADWLERVGLNADHMSRYPHEFSGGQRQRIGIARAMIIEPQFVVCDEPISALDVSVQAQVINLLDDLKKSMGLTLLFIAHDLSMVRYVSDRMAVMYMGVIVESGSSDEVFFNPLHPYTQFLIEANPEPDPASEKAKPFSRLTGEISSPVDIKPGCRFADRCPKASSVCREETPPLKLVGGTQSGVTRSIACHHA